MATLARSSKAWGPSTQEIGMRKRLSLAVGLAVALPALALSEPVRVQATAPGNALCLATSPAENAAAARATSRQRAAGRLPPVRADARLAKAAARHACDMAGRGLMTHEGRRTRGPAQRVKGAGYRPAVTAENIAAGPFDLAGVLRAWGGSSGHLGNIMLPPVADFGIGRAIAADGRTVFWAAVYAAPKG